ncbi:MAG: LysE family transporter [Bacteroidetes bacterium]|nr:LysE family transporter [Bacteroidota bacterium]MDA0930735.1 LysE family transporter [Bacteroidota bacterium]
MSDFIVSGLLMGLLLSIAAGPTMLALIQSSIAEGAKRTLFMELGVLISDAFLIAVTYFGLGQFLTVSPQLEPLYLSLGGALLIGMGAFKLKIKHSQLRQVHRWMEGQKSPPLTLMWKGFMYNSVNPSVLLFWIGSVTLITAQFEQNSIKIAGHFSVTLLVMMGIDILKIYGSSRLRILMTPRRLIRLSQFMGWGLMLFGLFLLVKAAVLLYQTW